MKDILIMLYFTWRITKKNSDLNFAVGVPLIPIKSSQVCDESSLNMTNFTVFLEILQQTANC